MSSSSTTPQNVYRYSSRTPCSHTPGTPRETTSTTSSIFSSLWNNNNISKAEEVTESSSLSPNLSSSRRRHYSGSVRRPPSILNGIRDLVVRQRSESFGATAASSLKKGFITKNIRKVQINGCKVDSVYDLREAEEADDFYNDEMAFRRPRSNSSDLLILRKTSRPLSVDVVGLVNSNCDPYRQYMMVVDCYELAPSAGNVIVVDREIKVGKAFNALCENKVGAALVWDSKSNKVVSIVTFTDFLVYLQNPSANEDEILNVILSENQLVTVGTTTKLFNACEEFCSNRLHRIVVCETSSGDVLYLLTIKRVLQAIHKQNRSLHFAQWLSMTIKAANVGKWNESICTVSVNDPLCKVIQLMLGHRLSSLPVVNEDDLPIDVICKSDLATALRGNHDSTAFFNKCTVADAIAGANRPPARFVNENDQVGKVLDILLSCHHTRCIFVSSPSPSSSSPLVASISLSDVLRYLMYTDNPLMRNSPQNSSMSPTTICTVFGTPKSLSTSPQDGLSPNIDSSPQK